MSAPNNDHPDRSDLEAFGVGELDLARSVAVEKHLAGCESCCEAVQKAPDDTLVNQLREAVTQPPQAAPAGPVPSGPETVGYPSAATMPVEAPADLVRHPRYRLLKLLGRGGMGAVYLAKHGVMRRLVALKVINREYTSNPAAAERFQREIRAAAQLHHPNIVDAYDAEQAGDTHFLVMEYVDGVSLDRLLAEKGSLPVAEACEYVRQAAQGLQHAHERGMVHRDVKPHNLIRAADGVVKVLDFGLASASERGEGQLTGTNVIMGTPDYIAPEQAEDTHKADARSDIYALGCTLYQLLTGRPPFTYPSALLKLVAHREEAPAPVRAVRPDVPEELTAVLSRMMAKAPAERFQTAAEVAVALAPFVGVPRAERRPPRRRLLVAGAAAALLMGLLAAAALVLRIPTDQGDVTITTDDPNIELVVRNGGQLVRIVDSQSKQTWELDPIKYQLGMADQPDGLTVALDGRQAITLKRKGEKLVAISRAPATEAGRIELVRRIPVSGAADLLYCSAVSAGGKYVLDTHEIGPGSRLDVFDPDTGERVFDCRGYCADFLDGERLLVEYQSTFRVYEAGTWKLQREAELREFWGMSIAPGGRSLLCNGPHGLYLYDPVEMKELHAWPAEGARHEEAHFSPDGKRLFLRMTNGPWSVWDVENNQAADGAGLADVGPIWWVFPDGKTAAAFRKGEFARIDVQTGKTVQDLKQVETAGALYGTYSRDGRCYVVWFADGRILQYRTPFSGKEVGRFQLPSDDRSLPRDAGPAGYVALAISEDNRFAAVLTAKTLYVLRLAPLPPVPE